MAPAGKIRRVIISIFAIILTVGFWFACDSSFFTLQDIVVSIGGENTPAEMKLGDRLQEIKTMLESFRGRSTWFISTNEVYASIANVPWIEQVEVRKVWPSQIAVSVRPRRTVAIISSSKGELQSVGVWGEILSASEVKLNMDLPLLQGSGLRQDQSLRRQAVELLMLLPSKGHVSTETVLGVDYNKQKGFVLQLGDNVGFVYLGEGQAQQKLYRVERVLEYLTTHSLESRVIDASFDKKVLVRLRKGP